MIQLKAHTWIGLAGSIAMILLMSGCASSGQSSTSPELEEVAVSSQAVGRVVTKFEVISHLEPLTKSVVAYTETDYGDDAGSPAVLAQVETNLSAIQTQEEIWRDFTSAIDYESSEISGLEQAISGYNTGLDSWQANQERGLANWKKCVSGGGGDLEVAGCMLTGYSIEDEQEALNAYSTPLKALLQTLGAM